MAHDRTVITFGLCKHHVKIYIPGILGNNYILSKFRGLKPSGTKQ
jgi:hypothetical protein